MFLVLLLTFGSDGYSQPSAEPVVYFNWNFLPVKNINSAFYYGKHQHIHGNRYEVTFFTLGDDKVAFGEYTGKNLKKKNGVFVIFNEEDKIIVSANYRKNALHGIYQRFYENGQLSDSGYLSYGENKGTWKSWYSTGQLKEVKYYSFKRGHSTLESEFKSWYPGGNIKDSGYYRNNARHGIWIEWVDDGNTKSVGAYGNGWKKGLWRYYDSKGKLAYMRRFNRFKYDEEGEYIPSREK